MTQLKFLLGLALCEQNNSSQGVGLATCVEIRHPSGEVTVGNKSDREDNNRRISTELERNTAQIPQDDVPTRLKDFLSIVLFFSKQG